MRAPAKHLACCANTGNCELVHTDTHTHSLTHSLTHVYMQMHLLPLHKLCLCRCRRRRQSVAVANQKIKAQNRAIRFFCSSFFFLRSFENSFLLPLFMFLFSHCFAIFFVLAFNFYLLTSAAGTVYSYNCAADCVAAPIWYARVFAFSAQFLVLAHWALCLLHAVFFFFLFLPFFVSFHFFFVSFVFPFIILAARALAARQL